MKKRIINVDETWINETNFIRKTWNKKNNSSALSAQTLTPRISLIAALDSDGQIWFTLTQTTTDSDIFMMFLQHLVEKLDDEMSGWRENTVFLWDNAKYHNNKYTKSQIQKLGIHVMFSGPYGYDAAPIETLFSHLKLGDLNPEKLPTGKR